MILLIGVQSFSDIITNSSSELFQIQQNEFDYSDFVDFVIGLHIENQYKGNWEDYYKESKEEKDKYDSISGMGGILEFKSWEEMYEHERDLTCVKSKRDQYTPEIWALGYNQPLEVLKSCIWLDIDQGFRPTIRYIIDNFNVIGSDCLNYWKVDPNTGERVRIITRETWEQLPKNERYPKDGDKYDDDY